MAVPTQLHINLAEGTGVHETETDGGSIAPTTTSSGVASSGFVATPQGASKDDVVEEEDHDGNIQALMVAAPSGHTPSPPSVTGIDPYFEAIENLGLKDEGCLYRLREKFISHSQPFHVYNQYKDVTFNEDRVAYSRYQRVPVVSRDAGEWIARRIYIHHREARGFYFLKYHTSWSDMVSQGQAHCFDRAHSNRYAAMALREFKHMFFIKRRDHHGRMVATYQRWHHEAHAMSIAPVHPIQSTGALYEGEPEGEPRWMICEGVTDRFSHRYVYKYEFNNAPMEYQPWTKLIQAFIHYVYDLSDNKTLISNLDCDEHGVISNVLCFTKNSPPYHSRHSVDMQGVVERAFIHFPDHHDCNELREHLGNIRMK